MNTSRMLVLGLAAVAAIAAVLLVRSLMGGGTPSASAMLPKPEATMKDVLVAAATLQPGQKLTPEMVQWQPWPQADVDSTFVTRDAMPNLQTGLTGTVVRAPMVQGEPLTNTKFVHGDAAGFLAATLQPGMRAVSVPITTDTGAGGFILPNDRVDVVTSELISDNPRRFRARIILSNILVIAMDQTYKQDKDQKVVLAKTATLELSAPQSRIVVKASAAGPLSLALRALGDPTTAPVVASKGNGANGDEDDDAPDGANVRVIRFGFVPLGANGRKE